MAEAQAQAKYQSPPPSPSERAVATWEEIHRRFFFYEQRGGEMVPYCSLYTLRTKHKASLLECGAVVRSYRGKHRAPLILGWPGRIQAWIQVALEKGAL